MTFTKKDWTLVDDLTAQKAVNARLRSALGWYGEQARLCRLIHSEGDSGRHALADDGGKRASAALAHQQQPASEPK